MAADLSPDRKFIIGHLYLGRKARTLPILPRRPKMHHFEARHKYLPSHVFAGWQVLPLFRCVSGANYLFRQPWRNATPIGSPVSALKFPFALRDDYNGNAFTGDLSSVVYARSGDLYLLSQKGTFSGQRKTTTPRSQLVAVTPHRRRSCRRRDFLFLERNILQGLKINL
jgi:hypothetical protein